MIEGKYLITLLLMCGTAQASEWVSIGKSDNGAIEALVDASDILIAGEIRQAWIKIAYPHHKSYTLERDAFNCGEETMRGEAFTIYFEDGTSQSQPEDSFPEPWKPRPPGTTGSAIIQFVCTWKPK